MSKNNSNLTVIILAAGKGSRMRSSLPKVCHPIGGLPMLGHVLQTALDLNPQQIITVISPQTPEVKAIADHFSSTIAYQILQEGTGHAVISAMTELKNEHSDILVIYGDTPLLQSSTLKAMVEKQQKTEADVVVMSMRLQDAGAYGRIFLDEQERPYAIIESRDATPEQLKNPMANSGVMLISGKHRQALLEKLNKNNAQNEYLLTDVIRYAFESGLNTAHYEGEISELLGVNNRIDLSHCEQDFQNRRRHQAMESGVTLIDPQSVTFSYDTKIATDVTIQPQVFFGPKVSIDSFTTVLSHCHIEGATIGKHCTIGPFARIRPTTILDDHAKVGNFVEIKNTHLHAHAKANHLSYIGDADVGEKANIGAGTITCNYDGYAKHKTQIGKGVFIGSNSALVAPVTIGDGAVIGAGSVITKPVTPDALSFSRSPQQELALGAQRYRKKKSVN
ncbi:MAG: bifunctional UDP-N-acetylglucosamine diphosphorylase/glucosamine-1-phosphate N-acetyltransferase GlmU [Alphaproteobacteria bacterium]|nr:bifunctional UDP-N-acetylglucosamine diphosphorylase/glucosamine-1-phosphate N-acetyltransferase GlmU [Alphaproteobacteria bacterium]